MPKRVKAGAPGAWGVAPADVPSGAVYVGGKRERWSNPFLTARRGGLAPREAGEVVTAFEEMLKARPEVAAAARRELAGRDLACECDLGSRCHADVLLEVANG